MVVFSESDRQNQQSKTPVCVFQELGSATWDALGANSAVDDLQHAAVTAGPHARGHPPFLNKGEKLRIKILL